MDKIGKFNEEQGKYEAMSKLPIDHPDRKKIEDPNLTRGLIGASEMIGYMFP